MSGSDRSGFTCEKCGNSLGDVRLVEHGYDDVALCKHCFRSIPSGEDDGDCPKCGGLTAKVGLTPVDDSNQEDPRPVFCLSCEWVS